MIEVRLCACEKVIKYPKPVEDMSHFLQKRYVATQETTKNVVLFYKSTAFSLSNFSSKNPGSTYQKGPQSSHQKEPRHFFSKIFRHSEVCTASSVFVPPCTFYSCTSIYAASFNCHFRIVRQIDREVHMRKMIEKQIINVHKKVLSFHKRIIPGEPAKQLIQI